MSELKAPEGFTPTGSNFAVHPDYLQDFTPLEGKTVERITATPGCINLHFANSESVGLWVHGDCCSDSYWHDLIGVDHLLEGARIVKVEDIELGTRDNPADEWMNHDIETTAYALKITSDHPTWGEVTTVFAYRNDSNGYYGGWCEIGDASDDGWPVTGNVLDVAELEQGGPQL